MRGVLAPIPMSRLLRWRLRAAWAGPRPLPWHPPRWQWPMPTGARRRILSSGYRRQAPRRRLRPGRPYQHLCHRCRRLDHDAADRLGSGARPHPGGTGRRDLRQSAPRLHSRALGRRRGRGLSAVLHPRRSGGARTVSLRAEHDRRKRGCHRRRLLTARAARPGDGDATPTDAGTARYVVPPGTSISPGDTVLVGERWF